MPRAKAPVGDSDAEFRPRSPPNPRTGESCTPPPRDASAEEADAEADTPTFKWSVDPPSEQGLAATAGGGGVDSLKREQERLLAAYKAAVHATEAAEAASRTSIKPGGQLRSLAEAGEEASKEQDSARDSVLSARGVAEASDGALEDSFDAEEDVAGEQPPPAPMMVSEEELTWKFIMDPDSGFRQIWDLCQVFLLLWVCMVVPLRTGFDLSVVPYSNMWWWELCLDVYFLTDIGFNFRTGYIDEQLTYIQDPGMISRQYIKGWFLIDVLACLPIGYITLIVQENSTEGEDTKGGGGGTKVLKVLRLLRIGKLLRVARIKRIMLRYAEHLEVLPIGGIMNISVVCLGVAFVGHMTCCVWYYVGYAGWHRGWDADSEYTRSLNISSVEWAAFEKHRALTTDERYLTSLLFTMGMLWNGGPMASDFLPGIIIEFTCPTTQAEVYLMLFFMISGTWVQSTVFATTVHMMGKSGIEQRVETATAELREFLVEKNVPMDTQRRVRRFMGQLYRQRTGYDEHVLLGNLPPELLMELLRNLYHKLLVETPVFRNLNQLVSPKVIYELIQILRPHYVQRGDVLFREGDLAREMFILEEGAVQLCSKYALGGPAVHKDSQTAVEWYAVGCALEGRPEEDGHLALGERLQSGKQHPCFGEEGVYNHSQVLQKRDRTAVAITDSKLFMLSTEASSKLFKESPLLIHRIQDFNQLRKTEVLRTLQGLSPRQLNTDAATQLRAQLDDEIKLLQTLKDKRMQSKALHRASAILALPSPGPRLTGRKLTRKLSTKWIGNTRNARKKDLGDAKP